MFRGVLGVEVCDLVRALRMLTHKIIAQPFNLHMNTPTCLNTSLSPSSTQCTLRAGPRADLVFPYSPKAHAAGEIDEPHTSNSTAPWEHSLMQCPVLREEAGNHMQG